MNIEANVFQISLDSPHSTAVAPSITLEESKDWSFNLPICSPPLWYHREIQMKLLKYFGKPENRNVFPSQVFNDIAIRCFVDHKVKEPKICTHKKTFWPFERCASMTVNLVVTRGSQYQALIQGIGTWVDLTLSFNTIMSAFKNHPIMLAYSAFHTFKCSHFTTSVHSWQ